MARASNTVDPMDRQIRELHRRYIAVMEDLRLASVSRDTKQRYAQMLKSLTDKLAVPSKPLPEIVTEMMAEAAPILFEAMQQR